MSQTKGLHYTTSTIRHTSICKKHIAMVRNRRKVASLLALAVAITWGTSNADPQRAAPSSASVTSSYRPKKQSRYTGLNNPNILDDITTESMNSLDEALDLSKNADDLFFSSAMDESDFDEYFQDSISKSASSGTISSGSSGGSGMGNISKGGEGKAGSAQDYGENIQGTEKGALYDAYNLLHTLAQDFQKPFDAPAVVVAGHQSSGKSALIEALMGFQFNQVGGGTKTRRPIALRMQYNPQCAQPRCYLQGDDGVERLKSLSEIQDYIEAENQRLERDPIRSFDSREINIRMEYKYCPNMILIDTPGLIAAPRIPRDRSGPGVSNAQHRALLKSAREAEKLVVSKIRCPDYIILCVEDSMDWKHGATREIVQKADPDLSRTVIVNTKLDTKIPQFGSPRDLCDFLQAEIINKLSPHKLGGPFFTSVPSGRVARPETSNSANIDPEEYIFHNDDEFVSSCIDNEEQDRAVVAQKLKNVATTMKKKNRDGSIFDDTPLQTLLPSIGLSRLRGFLERRVDECYRRNVAKIVPLLQAELASSERRLEACERQLEALSVDRLKAGADSFCDEFCSALKETIQGSVLAPPSVYGETLEQEIAVSGTFYDVQGCPMAVSDRTWDRLISTEVGNREHRLYGGAQYHRAMREFNLATRCLRLPTITEDEIANAAGVGDAHDGVNFLRAACVIALEKARTTFDPLLESMRLRLTHIMSKACPVSEYILVQKKERTSSLYGYGAIDKFNRMDDSKGPNTSTDIAQNPQFRQLVRTIYEKFVQKCSESTMMRCQDDLMALTRFVTWDLHERSSGALRRSLPDRTDIISVYQVAVMAGQKTASTQKIENSSKNIKDDTSGQVSKNALSKTSTSSEVLSPLNENDSSSERDYFNLLQLIEEAACSRDANRTNMVVGGLVQHIVSQWRETFAKSVTTKFNCYFLLPFVDEFHRYLRQELQKVYEGEGDNICEVFDLTAARRALNQHRQDLLNECSANRKLQEKFEGVSRMMREQQDKAKSDGKPRRNSN